MLKYMTVHLQYTGPAALVLLFLARPFLYTKTTWIKLGSMVSMALLYTTPWDNYIIHHNAWGYCPACVVGTIGYVPIEEYMFFCIQSIITGLLVVICTQFDTPTNHVQPVSRTMNATARWIPMAMLGVICAYGWMIGQPETPYFYLGSIMWWVAPVIALQLWVAGPYIMRQWLRALLCITVPTLYLCWVDTVAIGAGTWYISLPTSTGWHVVPHLPVEEAIFFTVSNVMLVFGMMAFDRTLAILKVWSFSSPDHHSQASQLYQATLTMNSSFPLKKRLSTLLQATMTRERDLPHDILRHLRRSQAIIAKGSKSFNFASKLLPFDSRLEFWMTYAMCRVTDDIADEQSPVVATREHRVEALKELMLQSIPFLDDNPERRRELQENFDPAKLRPTFTEDEIDAFDAFRRVSSVMPRRVVLDLIRGYEWDMERRPITNVQDLIQYSKYVGSAPGEMCTYIMIACSRGTARGIPAFPKHGTEDAMILQRAVDMGIALQVLNIARDIRTDASMGRCYVPEEWLPLTSAEFIANTPVELGLNSASGLEPRFHDIIRVSASNLLTLADEYVVSAEEGIGLLPAAFWAPIRIALRVYNGIGKRIRKTPENYPVRSYVPLAAKFLIMVDVLLCGGLFTQPPVPPAMSLKPTKGTASSPLQNVTPTGKHSDEHARSVRSLRGAKCAEE